jgi:predicted nucleic acid-binding protein
LNEIVIAASIVLAWCFPDETSDYAESVLVSLERKTILAPPVWGLEIANAIMVGERRKRLQHSEISEFASLLENLTIVQDTRAVADHLNDVLPLARKHALSAYDAAYLELSIRHGAPLATLDDKLRKAAKGAGVRLFA